MRLYNKYKNFSNQQTLLREIPLARVLNFKRTKWLRVQKSCQQLFKPQSQILHSKRFHNNLLISASLGKYTKLTRYFLDGIVLKRTLVAFFDHGLTVSKYKKLLGSSLHYLTYEEQYLISVIKPFFYLEILLWKLGAFSSIYAVLQFMKSGLIFVNGNAIFNSVLIKKNDVISFDFKISFLNNIQPKTLLFGLVEIDAYTQHVVLLKNFNEITYLDASLLISDALEINAFLNYIAKK